ncbi:unnamed protein product [Rotaria sordida]|uniref:Uncharacterized protein n=2 Tax=Rotaria sordida TaxID=392033 RepID=A0A815E2X2_9BILA|nr:unnamed protein product [Rotaria sordida]
MERAYEGYTAKVCDFGLTRTRDETTRQTTSNSLLVCTLQWTAPEILLARHPTDKTDIYSLGVVYWELATSEIPYDGLSDGVIRAFVLAGARLKIPEDTPSTFYELIKRCWAQQPNDRPSSSDVIEMIEKCIQMQSASTTTNISADKKKDTAYSSKVQKDTVAAVATTSTVNTGISSITNKISAVEASASTTKGASTTTDVGKDKKKETTYSSKVQKDTVAAVATTSTVNTGISSITNKISAVEASASTTKGSKLTQRIRSKAFTCLLRQEVAYFDRPENSSSAICVRLSSDASAVQEMTGTRLGAICEALSLARNIAASVSAAETFFDLFDRKPAIDNTSTEGQELVDFRGEIQFDQVKFIYPTRPTSIILNKFQLNIKPSQRVALVGTAGCGKSTIIQLLERFYDVTSGRLFLDGVDIRQLNLQWVRSHIGLVSQEPILFDLTIAENIAYGLENVSMEDIINAATKANIHQFIEQLPQGYETKVGLKGSFLSGGEKQRISIARVLIRRPKVLLLDEATSAMDSYNEQLVQEALEQAQREDSNRTSLITAHRLSTICSCDLICVLDRGHIVESGTHTELTQRRGAYYKMLAQNNLQ